MGKTVLMITFLALVFLPGSFAQNECEITDSLPIGLANQGGYSFNYQSRKGKECRNYRLRNTPGKVQTPVKWKDDEEIFLDIVLSECKAGSSCSWVEAVKISAQPTMIDKTRLLYGVNKDEYKEEPDAYRKKLEKKKKFPPFITIIRGTVADAHNKPLELAVQVSSYVDDTKPYRLTYVMSIVGASSAFEILRPGAALEKTLVPGLIWKAAASKPFFQYLDERRIQELSPKVGKVVVNITAEEIELEESKLLEVVQDNERVAATTAPAYRPKN